MLPSSSSLVTRWLACSQAMRRPWRSRVNPLASFVDSLYTVTPSPGAHLWRLPVATSLKRRKPPSFHHPPACHHTGPSATPLSLPRSSTPPNPPPNHSISSLRATRRSTSGAFCSIGMITSLFSLRMRVSHPYYYAEVYTSAHDRDWRLCHRSPPLPVSRHDLEGCCELEWRRKYSVIE